MNLLKLCNLQNINLPRPNQLGFTWNLKLTIFKIKLAFYQQNGEKIIKQEHSTFILAYFSIYIVCYIKITLIGPAQSSQFMEWHNLGIGTLKHAVCAPNVFQKLPENQITINFIYVISPNFVTILHINYWYQVNSWRNFLKFWNDPFCRNKSGLSALLNVAAYWQGSNTKTCAKKPSQILANNMDNGGEGDWCQNLCEVL